jgi:diaminopimelate decarboxylase
MNDLIRPALYQAHHDIETVLPPGDATEIVDVVGPVCESADTFAKQRELPLTHTGDLLGVRSVGAYGMVMASTYNGRLRPAEVLCDGNAHQLIRRRDDPEDLWRGEFPLHALPKPA